MCIMIFYVTSEYEWFLINRHTGRYSQLVYTLRLLRLLKVSFCFLVHETNEFRRLTFCLNIFFFLICAVISLEILFWHYFYILSKDIFLFSFIVYYAMVFDAISYIV